MGTLSESIARALKYNYDYRLANMQAVLRDTELGLASYAMLPAMTASAGYVHRTHELASSSESILTRTQSLEPSTSLDNDRMVADLNLSFPILFDDSNTISADYQVEAMPTTVILDRNGVIRYTFKGYRDGYEKKYAKAIKTLIRE